MDPVFACSNRACTGARRVRHLPSCQLEQCGLAVSLDVAKLDPLLAGRHLWRRDGVHVDWLSRPVPITSRAHSPQGQPRSLLRSEIAWALQR